MEEKKTSELAKNLKYILVLVGVLALVVSYFLFYKKYDEQAKSVEDEIEKLEVEYDAVKTKAALYNEKKVNEFVYECNKKYEERIKNFNGDITYQSQIMDTYNMTVDRNCQIPSLTMSDPMEGADDEAINSYLDGKGYSLVKMTYSITTEVPYDQMVDTINYFMEKEGKRKVPVDIGFAYNPTEQKVSLSFNIVEYAIKGEDRPVQDVVIPEHALGNTNIFYNPAVVIDEQAQ